MPAISPPKIEANARPRRSAATDPEIMASEATAAAPAPMPCRARRAMAADGTIGARNIRLAAP